VKELKSNWASQFYGSDNGITRGLIFCSRKKEAIELSTLFNLNGLKTVALTGDTEEEEQKPIEN
jgi:superfamily II DNA or RNA helicase